LDDLSAGRRASWAVFRSKWALATAVVFLETFRTRRVLWRYPSRLLDWIRSLGASNICVDSVGPDAEAAATLGALLYLADHLPDTEAFRQRLRARSTDSRDRKGWILASLDVVDDGTHAKVAEDLRLFDLPYTADILEARGYGPTRGRWAAAVLAARSLRYPGGGTAPPATSLVTGAAGLSPPGPSPPAASAAPSGGNSGGSLIISSDRVEHRDIPDVAFDQLDHIPSDRVPQGLARVVSCDPEELRGYTTGTLVAGLSHTVVSLGDLIAQWACDHPKVPLRLFEELLQLVCRRSIRAVLIREVGVAACGANRRQQHHRDRDAYHEEPAAQRPGGPPGPKWGGPSSARR